MRGDAVDRKSRARRQVVAVVRAGRQLGDSLEFDRFAWLPAGIRWWSCTQYERCEK
jgi:hypothetical protein